MRKYLAGLASLALFSSAAATAVAAPSRPSQGATSSPAAASPANEPPSQVSDDLPNPLEAKRRELRQTGLDLVLQGKAKPIDRNGSKVVKVADQIAVPTGARGSKAPETSSQYVELQRERQDRIFVVLAEFGNERHPEYPDQDTDPGTPGPATFEGPLHNQIPEPDRRVDNSTVWQPDYSRSHYQRLYFDPDRESVRTYYETQSSGRYSVDGTVTDWVKVPYNEARYGRSDGYPCFASVCTNTWVLVRDAVNAWEAGQRRAGRTEAQIAADLASFDEWDRYDFDRDGDFNEPDGYIDHFQIVHAGGDQADGDPQQGEDAIWSHRWYAYGSDRGVTGPPRNRLGGTEIGKTGLWVGDYTMQPENGGLSVFVHEYGHDLGLPDDYDTSGGGDNSQEYWTLMAQSRLSAARDQGLGTRAGDLGAWNKLQLGWLDHEIVNSGQNRTVKLGPSEYHTDDPQALVVTLPDKEVTHDYGSAYKGQHMWWSGSGDDLSNHLARDVDLTGATKASLTMKARYDIEAGFDFLYVQASTDGGATWDSLDGTIGGRPFPRDGSDKPAITGRRGSWTDLTVPLDAYVGKAVKLRLYYVTDGGVTGAGFFADEITLTVDGHSYTDGAESGTDFWDVHGFRITTGREVRRYPNYYVAASRRPVSFDRYLRTGPYNFGFPDKPDWVEHYAYQQGVLITYLDGSQRDNNVSQHPGEGRSLNIDSRPEPISNMCGTTWRTRIQVYDAPFTHERANSMTLHCNGRPSLIRGRPGQPVFDDRAQWWYPEQPNQGVKVPVNGVRIAVVDEYANGTTSVRVSSGVRGR
ncbi:MAG: protease [Acidimicrobiales bacterium]|nr:protease [Acidimicrobiales bacterium]